MNKTKTREVLEYAIEKGILIGDIDEIEKRIPHQRKMVLLRFWNDYQQYKTTQTENKIDSYLWDLRD